VAARPTPTPSPTLPALTPVGIVQILTSGGAPFTATIHFTPTQPTVHYECDQCGSFTVADYYGNALGSYVAQKGSFVVAIPGTYYVTVHPIKEGIQWSITIWDVLTSW
jgi:hypothetical protein